MEEEAVYVVVELFGLRFHNNINIIARDQQEASSLQALCPSKRTKTAFEALQRSMI